MEFEGLSPEVEWEARRIAAAFGFELWGQTESEFEDDPDSFYGVTKDGAQFEWIVGLERPGGLEHLWVGRELIFFWQGSQSQDWKIESPHCHNELIVRGLYCLGFDETDLQRRSQGQLTAHEQLELRLSMPREFWPQKWLDQEVS